MGYFKVCLTLYFLLLIPPVVAQHAVFETKSGKNLDGILLNIHNDTVSINTDVTGRTERIKNVHKDFFSKIVLKSGEILDLGLSNWEPDDVSDGANAWNSLALLQKKIKATKIALAVMPFESRGSVLKSDAESLTDRFTERLISTGVFRVMERSEMDIILKEQGFQQTGVCSDNGCLVEIGQLVAVQKIISGSIGKVGGIYTVTVKLLDVATGAIDKSISEDFDCTVEELLTQKMAYMANRMVGINGGGNKKTVDIRKGDASLFVKSTPSGARIFLNGKLMDGATPVTLNNIVSGKYTIRLTKGDMETSDKISLESNKITKLSLKLSKKKTLLKVTTEPSESEIYIDTKQGIKEHSWKLAPAVFENVKPGNHTVSVFKLGFKDTTLNINVIKNDLTNIFLELSKCSDNKTKNKQLSFVKKRRKHSIGIKFIVAGPVFVLGSVPFGIMSVKDRKDADAAENFMQSSVIKSGKKYDNAKSEYSSKDGSSNLKKGIFFGVAATGIVLTSVGVVLNF